MVHLQGKVANNEKKCPPVPPTSLNLDSPHLFAFFGFQFGIIKIVGWFWFFLVSGPEFIVVINVRGDL